MECSRTRLHFHLLCAKQELTFTTQVVLVPKIFVEDERRIVETDINEYFSSNGVKVLREEY